MRLIKKIEFPEDSQLISIGKEAIRKTLIKEVIFPKYLQVIESHAFYECKCLNSVTFPNDSEHIEIKEYAFDEARINRITIPNSVKKIGIALPNSIFKKIQNLFHLITYLTFLVAKVYLFHQNYLNCLPSFFQEIMK